MADDSDAIWQPGSDPSMPTTDVSTRFEDPNVGLDASDSTTDVPTRFEDPNSTLDSPWSPDSDVTFAPVAPAVFDVRLDEAGGGGAPSTAGEKTRRRTRRLIALAGVAGLVLGSIAVVRLVGADELTGDAIVSSVDVPEAVDVPERLVSEPFSGADRRRLPDALNIQWSSSVSGVAPSSRTQLTVAPDGTVIGVFENAVVGNDTATSSIVALDGATGTQRWRTAFDSQARAFTVLGVFSGVVALERLDTTNRSVIGLDASTGEIRWERETNDPGVHVVLEGAEIIARVSFTVNARLTFIDPGTGDEVGRVPGRLFATDFEGTWYVRNASTVVTLDLRNGWSDPEPSHRLDVGNLDAATVVDDQLLELDGAVVQISGPVLRSDSVGTAPENIAAERSEVEIVPPTRFTEPSSVQRFSPMVGEAFLLSGDNAVFGAVLGDGEIELRWKADGAVIDTVRSDRGLTLLLGSDGGGTQQVVDASTGRLIVELSMVPGAIETLQMVGNGVVVKQAATVGFERVGLDLDGNRLWSLVGEGPLAIGPGVVVTYGPSDDGLTVTAYGDSST
ncbi:MAG: PQQ-binding-like beta-propeller repeat protein [Ilumatobacter sp.]